MYQSFFESQSNAEDERINKLYEQINYLEEDKEMHSFVKELITVFYHSRDGIYVVDAQGFTLRVNPAFETITGIKAEDVIHKNVSELVERGYFQPSVALEVLKTKSSKTIVQENINGKVTLATGNPVFDKLGNVVRVVSNIRDITELTKLYNELSEKKSLLQKYSQIIGTINKKEIDGIVVASSKMKQTVELACRVAVVDSTVLLLGESGVGKGVLSRLIHNMSERVNKPFISVNCSSIPDHLLESELFGYSSGAFTGASKGGKTGLIEAANGGILFLDEIADLSLVLQPKILNFLETGEITKIGTTKPCQVNVRIIAATNRNLGEMVETGHFRMDLFYRLNVIPINIPPLRERRDDISPLIFKYVKDFNEKNKKDKNISAETIRILENYSWPGNVRELRNLIERLMVLSPGNEVMPSDLPAEIFPSEEMEFFKMPHTLAGLPVDMPKVLKNIEAHFVEKALEQGGSIRGAAKLLGVNPSTIFRRMKK